MFEAGALSKSLDKAHVCPVLFGIQDTDLSGPLKQFQTTKFDKEDFKNLVAVINSKFKENKLASKVLDSVFEKWWPELEEKVKKILDEIGEDNSKPIRKDRDLLEEVLELSRMTAKNVRKSNAGISSKAVVILLREYISLHDKNVIGEEGYQDTLNGLSNMKEVIDYLVTKVREKTPEIEDLYERFQSLTYIHENEEEKTGNDEKDDLPF